MTDSHSSLTIPLGERVIQWADELAKHSDDVDQLTCTYLTPAHRKVADQLTRWMRQAGFVVKIDAVGNVIGRYAAAQGNAAAPLVCTGSHYDTVRNGGRYDGRLGILIAIALVASLNARNQRFPFDLEVVAFADEESVRYRIPFLGSSAYAGYFQPEWLDACDNQGTSMRQALHKAGLDPEMTKYTGADLSRLQQYFEVHIEQGPVLLDRGLPVGAVSGIAGSVGRILTLTGQAGHAGTTPMRLRRDALCAAAEIILCVENRCSWTQGLVGTVSQVDIPTASGNVVPGLCRLAMNVRAASDDVRDGALAEIDVMISEICSRRGIAWTCEETRRTRATPCDADDRQRWKRAIAAQGIQPFALTSGAGHDALVMARHAPISMLFVRCGNGGISHNPQETVTAHDVEIATCVTERYLQELAGDMRQSTA
ncbi:N-carbamoyl-L-amino acid hydrolase [Achromobacter sp. 2789STDY5608633]|uniref:allantoate amidohydrolase n=1 Tax=Achromobacter sp. 2789STDY5608633 TaxID=1806501 RepID=UPI0006C54B0C|nr:allantoate amidohydrolase [Achromobacter sp. 2789STDY5608633]CUJ48940.1 N-carbamoyl-L-amino acid hydrolase [Achromobacter sp. 2789STDY5608633]